MEWKDWVAAFGVVLNGLPQGLLALSLGFASVPTALAFLIGAVGNALTGSVAVVSYQAETIALAGTMGKNFRDRLSMIFVGGVIMTIIGLFGLLERIVDFIGPVITSGMMAGVGIMLTRVSWDMVRSNLSVGLVSVASALFTYFLSKDLVYTITVSVLLSSLLSIVLKQGNAIQPLEHDRFVLQKITLSPSILRGALAMVCLNIGANIAFGRINGDIAQTEVNIDTLSVISSVADMVSSLFGGAPVEAIISATSSAPHPVASGVLMMVLMAAILFAGLLPKIGRFIPSQSISGFLFVLGAIVTVPGNAASALAGEDASSGFIGGMTMAVTAISDPFFGMLAGLVMRAMISLFGI
ncbi:solute carrier family 23 protein [Brevibacillus fulvus]|uniref:AGZA family xanthine/uracil permease-like MFS transporter n=1 Tax=Brevibacillus fulvus TaxID=1125967 RepID=A0A939BR66_9BACL|nr:solute carrier family 23 protein [Brevibacillus fulvus]MBM7589143.1 AGZA family xanthine/uracil permease-like MFS transporter [Brevibacillus fulvus]